VAIIGVLSVLAVVGFKRVMNSAHTSEAVHMLGAIRIGQEAIRSETGAYLDVSGGKLGVNGNNLTSCYPPGTPIHNGQVSFNGHNVALWDQLNVQSSGGVQFGYTTIAGAAGTAVPGTAAFTVNGNAFTWPASGSATLNSSPWYIAAAQNDYDDVSPAVYVSVVMSSWSNGVAVDNEGE
jgi:type II secretory pathway pseudopilin PulG